MVTALLIVGAVVLVLLILGVVHQMWTSPMMWLFHVCCGTLGNLLGLLGQCVVGVIEGLAGSNG